MRLPPELLTAVDARAAERGSTRAATVRALLSEALAEEPPSGVDLAQLQRVLRMTPRERVQHAAAAANHLSRVRRAAHR